MTEFDGGPLPCAVPDDLTLAQFILDTPHAIRPVRPQSSPWLIEDATGRQVGFEEVSTRGQRSCGVYDAHTPCALQQIRARVHGLANALSSEYNIRASPLFASTSFPD
jgi:hypothetical protein